MTEPTRQPRRRTHTPEYEAWQRAIDQMPLLGSYTGEELAALTRGLAPATDDDVPFRFAKPRRSRVVDEGTRGSSQ
jgi:hypothetical protein